MEMDLILKIVAVIALLGFVVLSGYMIFSLNTAMKLIAKASVSIDVLSKELTKSMTKLTGDIEQLKDKVIESLENVDAATKQAVLTTQKIENEFDSVFNILQPFAHLIKNLYERIANPLTLTAGVITAASKAVTAFVNVFAKRNKE
jgi:hypothetical protein